MAHCRQHGRTASAKNVRHGAASAVLTGGSSLTTAHCMAASTNYRRHAEMSSAIVQSDHTILRVLVGSHAHGLAGPESDKDFRSVFAMPTMEMFRLGFKYRGTRMMKEEA